MSAGPRCVELVMVDIRLITRTNSSLNSAVVERIIEEGIDPDRFGALPAYFDGVAWTITDGNHRLAAASILGMRHVPVAPLMKDEYNLIAFSKTRTIDLMVVVPDELLYYESERPWAAL